MVLCRETFNNVGSGGLKGYHFVYSFFVALAGLVNVKLHSSVLPVRVSSRSTSKGIIGVSRPLQLLFQSSPRASETYHRIISLQVMQPGPTLKPLSLKATIHNTGLSKLPFWKWKVFRLVWYSWKGLCHCLCGLHLYPMLIPTK